MRVLASLDSKSSLFSCLAPLELLSMLVDQQDHIVSAALWLAYCG